LQLDFHRGDDDTDTAELMRRVSEGHLKAAEGLPGRSRASRWHTFRKSR
jgi:hypothetical protein